MRLWPDSLAGRTLALLIGGVLIMALAAGALLLDERRSTFRVLKHGHLADQISSLYRRIDWLDDTSLATLRGEQRDGHLEYAITHQPMLRPARPFHPIERFLHRGIRNRLPELERDEVSVGVVFEEERKRHRRFRAEVDEILVSIRLDNGQWLNIEVDDYSHAPPWAGPTLALLLLILLSVSGLVYWSSRRLSRPMRQLAEAAERLGRGEDIEALPEKGPKEVRETINAFNRMQASLQRNLRERSLMLSAVSHDLRTPITTLRLRAEYIDDKELREKTLATLAQMESILNDTLAFARDENKDKQHRDYDLAAMLQTLCDDYTDQGKSVSCDLPNRLIAHGRPAAIQRAVSNLLSNALRYAGNAHISLEPEDDGIYIRIDDDGPGIPEEQLEDVFTPFMRLEDSRNEETGGIGLGLAIARLLVHAQGGRIVLSNRPSQGLSALIVLPIPSV